MKSVVTLVESAVVGSSESTQERTALGGVPSRREGHPYVVLCVDFLMMYIKNRCEIAFGNSVVSTTVFNVIHCFSNAGPLTRFVGLSTMKIPGRFVHPFLTGGDNTDTTAFV